jgi:hypothetical protein
MTNEPTKNLNEQAKAIEKLHEAIHECATIWPHEFVDASKAEDFLREELLQSGLFEDA